VMVVDAGGHGGKRCARADLRGDMRRNVAAARTTFDGSRKRFEGRAKAWVHCPMVPGDADRSNDQDQRAKGSASRRHTGGGS
jgi:hypothetical protein